MTTEELRRQSLEQFASLRRKAMFEAQQNAPITVTPNAAGASGGGSSKKLTPFIVQAWGLGEFANWSLYRLTTDGDKIPVENAPPLEGPSVFSKNTLNGLHYYVTYSLYSSNANFGSWNSVTGEWQFLEEGDPLLRNLAPATLQYVEGIEGTGNYFIYTDNSQYTGPGTDNIGAKTYRIDLSTPTSFEMTELHEWDPPVEVGPFPISTFYQLPVDTEAIPPQNLFQAQQYGFATGSEFPFTILLSINGETYEQDYIDIMAIEGVPIEAAKIAYVLDRTDYNGDTYFNVLVNDKINNTQIAVIAKFDPTENPSNLTSIYQYSWDENPYIALTTI